METIPLRDVKIKRNFNARQDTDPPIEMIESILETGMVAPIIMGRIDNDEKPSVIDGERRFRAARKCGLTEIDVVDLGQVTYKEALIISFTANENREPLTKEEQVNAVERLMKHDATTEEIKEAVGLTARKIKEIEKILKSGTAQVKKAAKKPAKKGGISTRVGSQVSSLPKRKQNKVLSKVKGKPTAAAEKEVKEEKKKKKSGRMKIGKSKAGSRNKVNYIPKDPADFPLTKDVKERCKIIQKEVTHLHEYYPKNPRFKAILDVIYVLRGEKDPMWLFRGDGS